MTTEAPKDRKRRQPYLAALPDGWAYASVTMQGPDGVRVVVTPGDDGLTTVAFRGLDGQDRDATAPSFADGVRDAITGISLLDRIARDEVALRDKRHKALTVLGQELDA